MIKETFGLIFLVGVIYLIVVVRQWWKHNYCVKCGKQFWRWNVLNWRKMCEICVEKTDKEEKISKIT